MAANKRKILEAARKYAQKGAKDRALKEYEQLLRLDPKDAKLRLEIGDAHRRWGQVEEAIAAYTKVADQYTKEGFDARAVAVYKQIQNLAPESFDSFEPLAELYQRMGLTAEAIAALQTAADGYHRQGKKRNALDLLRKMATLDPTNTGSRLKVADLLRQEKLFEDAVEEYDQVAAELQRQGVIEAVGTVLERILEIDPNRASTVRLLAANLLARGMGERAEPYAKRLLDANPEGAENYELLAEVYRAQKREDALADIYRRLADLYRRRGDEEQARQILQRFVPPDALAPGLDREVLLGGEEESVTDEASLIDEEFLDDGFGEDLVEQAPELEPEAQGPGAQGGRGNGAGAARRGSQRRACRGGAGGRHRAAVRRGERLSALRQTGAGDREPARDPGAESAPPGGAREAGRCACRRPRAAGGGRGVAACGRAGARGVRSPGPRRAARPHRRARRGGRRTGRRVAAGRGAAEPEIELSEPDEDFQVDPAPARPAPTAAAADEEPEIDLGDIEIEIDDEEPEPDEAAAGAARAPAIPLRPKSPPTAPRPGPGDSASTSQQIGEDLEEADFYYQQGLHGEAEAIYQRVLALAPNHPLALVRLGEIAAAQGSDPGATGGGVAAATAEPDVEVEAAEPDSEIGRDLADWSHDLAPEPVAAVAQRRRSGERSRDRGRGRIARRGGRRGRLDRRGGRADPGRAGSPRARRSALALRGRETRPSSIPMPTPHRIRARTGRRHPWRRSRRAWSRATTSRPSSPRRSETTRTAARDARPAAPPTTASPPSSASSRRA